MEQLLHAFIYLLDNADNTFNKSVIIDIVEQKRLVRKLALEGVDILY
jgi:hypothetical protein